MIDLTKMHKARSIWVRAADIFVDIFGLALVLVAAWLSPPGDMEVVLLALGSVVYLTMVLMRMRAYERRAEVAMNAAALRVAHRVVTPPSPQ